MELLGDDNSGWRTVTELLAAGGVVAVPTDTVYGVAAAVARPAAVARLFALKARDLAKPLAVLVADMAQAALLVEVSPLVETLAARWWPGALTLVLPRREGFGVDLGGAGDTIGVRCPAHEALRGVCAAVGPLATTSANRSGRATPATADEVADELRGTTLGAVLDGGPLPGAASTVVRVVEDHIEVLREGPITARDLAASARAVS